MQQTTASAIGLIERLATDVLELYASGAGSPNTCRHDAGPIVLAWVTSSVNPLPEDLERRIAHRWLDELPDQIHSLGAFGGLGGFHAAVHALIAVDPGFAPLAGILADQTQRMLADIQWQTSPVAWADYDLFRGPAGLILGGVRDGAATTPFEQAARHLALLCDRPSLEHLRAGTEIDPRSAFNIGRINTGMGHGVTGVAAALRQIVETFDDSDRYRLPLRHACDWLVEETYLAEDDFITWPPVGRDGARASRVADRRQAWCYGTPGIAWTLWDAGRVLNDTTLQGLAESAMRSFCRLFDSDRHFEKVDIGEELAICHGAAGTLAVADAFARHAGLREAAILRDILDQYLLDRANHLIAIAGDDVTILNGAGGIVSVMLTVHGGTRDWLPLIALR